MMLGFLKDKVIVILATLFMVSLLSNAVLYVRVYFKDQNISALNEKIVQIDAVSKAKEEIYNKRVESYEYAIEEITQFYDFELKNIDDFKKDDNETECDSAARLLSGFKY